MTTTETGQSRSLVEDAASGARDVAETAEEKASELAERGKGRLSRELDRRTTVVGSQARTMAQALRQSGTQLDSQGQAQAGSIAAGAADGIERLGRYLETTSGDKLLGDVEDFTRRRPWLLAGAGVLAGIAASRFLKASSEQRYTGSGRRPAYRPQQQLAASATRAEDGVYAVGPR